MRFDINISILFTELAYLERCAAARAAGFDAIESWWPADASPEDVADAVAESGLRLVALNFDAGDMAAGDRGLLSDLDRHDRFRDNIPVALDLARATGCRRLNALVGVEQRGQDRDEQLALAADNVCWAADQAADHGVEILIEAVNRQENGPYLLGRVDDAVSFIERVRRPNVRLLFDVYHAQRSDGDLIATARRHFSHIAHVQIADSPDRHEPGTGEINYASVVAELARLGYDGHVGLEYKPRADTPASLSWLAAEQRAAPIDPQQAFTSPAAGVQA